MPPRFAYWTILAGGLPTAFRAAERDDLLPTFRRIQEKHPDAEMKWFARGRLWASPEDARQQAERVRERRDRTWRPGGDHRDRREPHKAAARERNQERRRQRFDRKQRASSATPASQAPTPKRALPTGPSGQASSSKRALPTAPASQTSTSKRALPTGPASHASTSKRALPSGPASRASTPKRKRRP